MRLKSLKFEQFRGFAQAIEIQLHDKFTLIAGENGVGKSSILWAIRVLLSHILYAGNKRTAEKLNFRIDDVAVGWPYLRAEAVVHSIPERVAISCVAQKNVSEFVKTPSDDGRPREHAVDTPDSYQLSYTAVGPPHNTPSEDVPSLAVYYSAHRSLARDLGISKARAAGGTSAAYAEALEDRELRLGEQASLWRKEAALEESDDLPAFANRAIEQVLPIFLGDFSKLRTEDRDEKPKLVIDKLGKRLELEQLSDGERGLLTILMDLTRRLSQLNPTLENPARDGRAVVLIDELDLHLHPKWQRTAVHNLLTAFPNVQFIATTHSPQILGEVSADQIILLQREGPPIHPAQTFGMDCNWILRHIMDADNRNPGVEEKLEAILKAIREAKLKTAHKLIAGLRATIGETPDLAAADAKIARAELLLPQPKKKAKKPAPKKRRGS
ncbi:MAG: AAA family ATPase [Planctomycetota bacterium]|nr:AAA family ATPase [Planctomycetota bacterium]